jgi:hypothetical protein
MAKQPSSGSKGKIVTRVRVVTPAGLVLEDGQADLPVAVLEFRDGACVYLSYDPETHDPVAVFVVTASGQTLWVTADAIGR